MASNQTQRLLSPEEIAATGGQQARFTRHGSKPMPWFADPETAP